MIQIRKSNERGKVNEGWLQSFHTFSFGSYHDAAQMGFRSLRVINEDTVAPNQGFDTHGHQNMEILSYILDGTLSHKDSMGNGSDITPGEVQYMSAGSGVTHSEANNTSTPTHFLQIWIKPKSVGDKPAYDQRHFSDSDKEGKLRLIASSNGADDSIQIRQDVDLYASILNASSELTFHVPADRFAWVQVIRGELSVNDQILSAGDAARVTPENKTPLALALKGVAGKTEFLLFDLS